MKRIFIALAFVLCLAMSGHAQLYTVGVPENVTVTTTPISIAYTVSSGNSACAWTKLAGSDTFHREFWITKPGATYDVNVTYNSDYSGTTLTVNDQFTIKAADTAPVHRNLYLPNGAYVNLTFVVVHDATTGPTVNVGFESQK